MNGNVLLLTGAAGFLGSAIAVALSRELKITAVDVREPSRALIDAAPNVTWEQLDIADAEAVASSFQRTIRANGRIDLVIHFAAFYHFGTDWRPEYEQTNVRGTANLLRAAADAGVRRVVFASSIAAMEPPPAGQMLTESTPTSNFTSYARSKTLGEEMLVAAADRLPGIVLRLGGAFSDWCELPPLHSLIKLWSGRGPLSRIVPGHGESGFPYIHRDDVTRIVRHCIERHESLAPFEVFLASHQGAVLHKDLLPVIRGAAGERVSLKPIFIPPGLARVGLALRLVLGRVAGETPFERPWMLAFVDRPWVADVSHAQRTLGWSCSPLMGILDRLPVILQRFSRNRREWEERNERRRKGMYVYAP